MSFNPYWVGREVHLWGFVVDGKGRASQSQYLGGGILGGEEPDSQSPNQQNDGPVAANRIGEATAYQTGASAAQAIAAEMVPPNAESPYNSIATACTSGG